MDHLAGSGLEEGPRGRKLLLFEVKEAVGRDSRNLLAAEEGVNRDDLLEQVSVDRLIPPICLNLLQDSIGDGVEHSNENFLFELRETLVCQTRD